MNPDKLLQPADVARMAGVTPKTVSRWAKEGRLKCQRTAGNHRRFRLGDVLALLHRDRQP